MRCRHCSRLRRRCVLWRKSARLAARSRKICVVKTRIDCRIFEISARGARMTRFHFLSACGVQLLTFAQLSFELMQHLATQTLAFSTEIAQIFRARKAKNSRICCKIFASFSSVRCTELLTSTKFWFEAAPRPRLRQCSVWQRKKFACNADSAEIVQIFRAKVRELVANFLRLWCTTHHKSSRRRRRTLKCRNRSRLRRRRVL